MDVRYSTDPKGFKMMTTEELRKLYCLETLFASDEVPMVYSDIDRLRVLPYRSREHWSFWLQKRNGCGLFCRKMWDRYHQYREWKTCRNRQEALNPSIERCIVYRSGNRKPASAIVSDFVAIASWQSQDGQCATQILTALNWTVLTLTTILSFVYKKTYFCSIILWE